MSDSAMTPKESLEVITGIISEAKARQEENGLVYMVWGILIAVVGGIDFYLRVQEMYNLIWVPYTILPFGGIWSFLYYRGKQGSQSSNLVGSILRILWIIASANMMILGFGFVEKLGNNLTPVILILLGTALSLSGAALRYNPLLYGGIFANVVALGCFFLPPTYLPLAMAVVSLISVFGAGVSLRQAHQRRMTNV